jgi:predicted acetyltransferase
MLSAALPICKGLGLDRILVTCLDTNEGSRRTILKNGGVYESTVFEPGDRVNLQRYWIGLDGPSDC